MTAMRVHSLRRLVLNACAPAMALMALASCSSKVTNDHCSPNRMCQNISSTARLTSGSITLTLPPGEPETYRPGEECAAKFGTSISSSSYGGDSPSPLPFLRCNAPGREFSIMVYMIRNPALLPIGKQRWAGEAGLRVASLMMPDCSTWHAEQLIVEVTERHGEAVGNKGAVSSDYLRRFTVHLDAVPDGDAGCAGASVVVDVAVEQAASDVVTTDVPCGICID